MPENVLAYLANFNQTLLFTEAQIPPPDDQHALNAIHLNVNKLICQCILSQGYLDKQKGNGNAAF